jgi:hypothetical protein
VRFRGPRLLGSGRPVLAHGLARGLHGAGAWGAAADGLPRMNPDRRSLVACVLVVVVTFALGVGLWLAGWQWPWP